MLGEVRRPALPKAKETAGDVARREAERGGRTVDPVAISQVLDQIHRIVHSDGFAGGLYPAQWCALRFVKQAGAAGSSVTAFARYHQSQKASASQTMEALVRKGLIAKRRDPYDGRAVLLTVTEAGSTLLTRDPLLALSDAIAAMPPARQWQVAEVAESLLRGVLACRSANSAERLSPSGAERE